MLYKLSVLTLSAAAFVSAAHAQQTRTLVVPVPPDAVRQMMVFEGGTYLGVQTVEITKDNFTRFGLRDVRGAAVDKVSANSPAAQAGLQKGDVILKYNGEEISGSRKLTRLIQETAPDHQAVLTILRDGTERDVTVTLAKRQMESLPPGLRSGVFNFPTMPNVQQLPETPVSPFPPDAQTDENGNFMFFRSETRQIGITTTPLSKQLAAYFGAADGVLVSSVRENSPAAKAGLKAGDVIVEADGGKINNAIELTKAFGEKKEGAVNLTIIRDKIRQTVQVTPETVKN